jgi:hypothetical protein
MNLKNAALAETDISVLKIDIGLGVHYTGYET